MNEVSETCSLCNKPNDQMLMLSCVHDPCINCAATAFAEQVHIKGQNKEVPIPPPSFTSARSAGSKPSSIIPPSSNSPLLPALSSNCPPEQTSLQPPHELQRRRPSTHLVGVA